MTTAVERPLRIAVIGASEATGAETEAAEAVGRVIGAAGAVLVCGGRGGVMSGAARGATAAGGLTVGVLPGSRADEANDWIALPIPTGIGEARNAIVAATAEAVIAVGGAWGTLSEIAFAKKRGTPVAMVGRSPAGALDLEPFDEPEAAARWALEQARARRGAST